MNEFPVALGNGEEVITFDLGGTSFRSALITREGRLTGVQRVPSINFRSLPHRSAPEIVDEIAGYVARTAEAIWPSQKFPGRYPRIAISMGAALDAHTGIILGSGPILGDDSSSFDLARTIRHHLPDARVAIVNDVTASLVAHSLLPGLRHSRRLALITVSTGIASRVLSCSVPHVPVDPTLGTQGEIGHHRIAFWLAGRPLSLQCDCGGSDHLNAFASGNGIQRVLEKVPETFNGEFSKSSLHNCPELSLSALLHGLTNGDALARKILKAITAPVAEAIKWHFMLDPEIDQLILTGGVSLSLGNFYLASIFENLSELEFYPLTQDREAFWADRVILGPATDDAGMIGAAYVAREAPLLHRRESLNSEPAYRVSRQNAVDYPVEIVQDIFEKNAFPKHLIEPFERIVLVADSKIDELYGEAIRVMLSGPRRNVDTVILQANESDKNLAAVTEVVSAFETLGLRRRKDLVVAAGGGITLDIVGFSASIFRRGVSYMRLPTSLVAEIDAGIGVKTGVNFRQKKSRLGTFSAPYAVVVDPCFLSTLPDRQIRNGLSEALKIALVADRTLFDLIEENAFHLLRTRLQCPEGVELIRRAIRAMLLELSPNLYERTLDRLPDYGHTFSPVFEFELDDLQHGEAVALDMALATALAALRGTLNVEQAERILDVQFSLGLPIAAPEVTVEMLLHGVCDAKKHRGGQLRMPILTGIGHASFIDEISEEQLNEALSFVRAWSSRRLPEVQSA